MAGFVPLLLLALGIPLAEPQELWDSHPRDPLAQQLHAALCDRHLQAVENTCERLFLRLAAGEIDLPRAQRLAMARVCMDAKRPTFDWADAERRLTRAGIGKAPTTELPFAPAAGRPPA